MANCFLNPEHPSHKALEAQIEAELKKAIEADPMFGTEYMPFFVEFEREGDWDIYSYNGRRVLMVGPLQCAQKMEGDSLISTFSREIRRLNAQGVILDG